MTHLTTYEPHHEALDVLSGAQPTRPTHRSWRGEQVGLTMLATLALIKRAHFCWAAELTEIESSEVTYLGSVRAQVLRVRMERASEFIQREEERLVLARQFTSPRSFHGQLLGSLTRYAI